MVLKKLKPTALGLMMGSLCVSALHAQQIDLIMGKLHTVSDSVARVPCNQNYGPVLTNRAVNMLLYEKTATYLTGLTDFSLRKNYVTFQTNTNEIALGHSFYQPQKSDRLVRSFFVAGISAVVRSALPDQLLHAMSGNLAATLKQTWLGKTTVTGGCSPATASQRQLMDASRAAVLQTVEAHYRQAAHEFEEQLSTVASDSVKNALRKTFYDNLDYNSNQDFADGQAQALLNTNYYHQLTTHWTSLSLGIPLMRQAYTVAENYSASFARQHSYPLSMVLSHTRFRETPRGRWFVTVGLSAYLNNTFTSNGLLYTTYGDYTAHGGKDTTALASQKGAAYIGTFQRYVTPVASLQCIYFPVDSHVGISLAAFQNFFTYNALTVRLGIPVVLIDKRGSPAINFEFRLNYYDVADKVLPDAPRSTKLMVGVSVGVPVSKVMF
ncbi:hypothetical protein [Chryseolinea lacunae]|uniref:Porin n=1 Tax=Chryseolinea lacunae TaxID=2801331 RepID=A0ABS1KKI0_9BACT|nr:hypothetical protein [Chryseolinea lacunae]MBL0739960.1 hypothetical protein [Chryseolinea lacunae]